MTSQHPSETEGASDSPHTEAIKRRSPIGRAIVWGGIVLLAIVALVEARAQRGYAISLNQLQQALADNDDARLPMANARAMLTFSPRESGPVLNKRSEAAYTFSWFSLFKPALTA